MRAISTRSILKIRKALKEKELKLKRDSVLVFTCGAVKSNDPHNPSAREVFLEYAENHIDGINFFEAEKFFDSVAERDHKDLLSWEKELAGLSDCILIILESPGAQTEFGAFTVVDDLAKIVLAVNDKKFKNQRSFITDGPAAKVDKESLFKPTIYVDLDQILAAAGEIEDRLTNIKDRSDLGVDLSSFEAFKKASGKSRMLFIADIITLFSPIEYKEIIYIFKNIYGNNNYKIHTEVGLLASLDLVQIDDRYYVSKFGRDGLFFRYDQSFKWTEQRSSVLSRYFQRDQDRLSRLDNRKFVVDP